MNKIDVLKIVNWFRVKNNADIRENPENVDELTQMKVMKLLYYVQGVYLAINGERAFDNEILAWKYGPVVKEVHDKYRGRKSILGTISYDDLNDYDLVDNDDKLSSVINSVDDAYGDMSAIELMKQTHSETPWIETWKTEKKN